MTYRIATVSFLNAWPLVDALDELAPERVRVIAAVPSVLPELLHADEADAALSWQRTQAFLKETLG